eukprot:tig00000194_g14757.t1
MRLEQRLGTSSELLCLALAQGSRGSRLQPGFEQPRALLEAGGFLAERRAAFSAVSQGAVGERALVCSDMGDKREAAAAVPEATAAPVFKELEPARKRRRRTQPARGGPTAQTLTLAAPDFLCCETEPVGYLKFTHILPFLKDGLKVRLFVAKIDVYVVDEGFFFVGIGILVPKGRVHGAGARAPGCASLLFIASLGTLLFVVGTIAIAI